MSVKPDVLVSVAAAQAIVDRALPGRTVSAVSTIHGGEISGIYEVALGEGQAPVVLKVYPDAWPWKMQKELLVCSLITERTSVPVPRILLADDTKSLLAHNFIVMNKLEGEILGRLEPTLRAEELSSAFNQMGEVLRQFHSIGMEGFGYIGPHGVWTPHPSNRDYMAFQFDKKLKEFVERGGPPAIAEKVERFYASRMHLVEACDTPVLCHNDLHLGNILAIRADNAVRLSGVVDFENALAGDPLKDIAKTLYYYAADGYEAKLASLLTGYGGIDRQDLTETLDLYHLNFVVELWCWLAQIGNTQPLAKLAQEMQDYSDAR